MSDCLLPLGRTELRSYRDPEVRADATFPCAAHHDYRRKGDLLDGGIWSHIGPPAPHEGIVPIFLPEPREQEPVGDTFEYTVTLDPVAIPALSEDGFELDDDLSAFLDAPFDARVPESRWTASAATESGISNESERPDSVWELNKAWKWSLLGKRRRFVQIP